MFRIKDIVPNTLKSLGINKQYNAQSVIVHWPEIAGDEIATHAWPISIKHGVLLLAVNNPVWSHHLMMLKPGIINKINMFLHEKLVADIRFQAGDLKKYQNHEEDEQSSLSIRPAKLDSEELTGVWEATEPIKDINLRKKCYYVLIKQTGIDKAKKKAGWQSCKRCSVLVQPGQNYCSVCSLEYKQEKNRQLFSYLRRLPGFLIRKRPKLFPVAPASSIQVKNA